MEGKILRIPPKHEEILVNFFKLESKEQEKIIKVLENETITGLGPKESSTLLTRSLEPYLNYEGFIEVVFNLLRTKLSFSVNDNEFLEKISRYFSNKKIQFGDKERELFLRLFKSPVAITVKAIDLLLEVDKTFLDSRIVTDVRPLFTNELEPSLIGNIITHSLRIEYKDSDSINKTIFFALDRKDLQKLREQINRADSKETIMKDVLKDKKFIDLKF